MKLSYFLSFAIDDGKNLMFKKRKFNIYANDPYNNTECAICMAKFSEIPNVPKL